MRRFFAKQAQNDRNFRIKKRNSTYNYEEMELNGMGITGTTLDL